MDTLKAALKDLGEARAEYTRLLAIENKLELERDALQVTLQNLTADRGTRVLAALENGAGEDAARELSLSVAEKRSEIETADAVLAAIKPRIKAAWRAILHAKEGAFLAEAAKCEALATERQAKTDELLKQLKAWEGVDYGPLQPEQALEYGVPRRGDPQIITLVTPATERLKQQAGYYRLCATLVVAEKPFPVSLYDGLPPFPAPEWYKD